VHFFGAGSVTTVLLPMHSRFLLVPTGYADPRGMTDIGANPPTCHDRGAVANLLTLFINRCFSPDQPIHGSAPRQNGEIVATACALKKTAASKAAQLPFYERNTAPRPEVLPLPDNPVEPRKLGPF
jgi:hypothetical protein